MPVDDDGGDDGLGGRTASFEMRSSPSVTRDDSSGSLEALLRATSPNKGGAAGGSPSSRKSPPRSPPPRSPRCAERFDIRGRANEKVTIERSDEALFLRRLEEERDRQRRARAAAAANSGGGDDGGDDGEKGRLDAAEAERRAARFDLLRDQVERNRRSEAATRLFDEERARRVLESAAPNLVGPAGASRFLMLRDIRKDPDAAGLKEARDRCNSSPSVLPGHVYEQIRTRQIRSKSAAAASSSNKKNGRAARDDAALGAPAPPWPDGGGGRRIKRSETWAAGDDDGLGTVTWSDLMTFFCSHDPHDDAYYATTPGFKKPLDPDDDGGLPLYCGGCIEDDVIEEEADFADA